MDMITGMLGFLLVSHHNPTISTSSVRSVRAKLTTTACQSKDYIPYIQVVQCNGRLAHGPNPYTAKGLDEITFQHSLLLRAVRISSHNLDSEESLRISHIPTIESVLMHCSKLVNSS